MKIGFLFGAHLWTFRRDAIEASKSNNRTEAFASVYNSICGIVFSRHRENDRMKSTDYLMMYIVEFAIHVAVFMTLGGYPQEERKKDNLFSRLNVSSSWNCCCLTAINYKIVRT